MKTQKRSLKGYALLLSKGMAMGAADVVPGVSGGTIALLTGIYDELLHSLSSCKLSLLPSLFKEGIGSVWRQINGWFLLVLFSGILISIKTFAAVISHLLDAYPILVWSFFSGLILASIPLLINQQGRWRIREWSGMAIGAVIVFGISIMSPAQLPAHWWIMFMGGFVAISAMILPGVSGSFLLLLVGLYPVFIDAINELQWFLLCSFAAGCVAGLLIFSRFLTWLLDRYHSATLSVLIGFLVGSLNVTWPWKEVITTTIDRHGEIVPVVQKNIMPGYFLTINATDPLVLTSVFCAFLGVFLILFAEFFSRYYSK